MILSFITTVLGEISDFFFPPFCFDCKGKVAERKSFCDLCTSFLLEQGVPDKIDSGKRGIHVIYSGFHFESPIVRSAVHAIKYQNNPGPACELLNLRLPEMNFDHYDILVPIPLHPKRERWRGYNQAKLLADVTGEYLDLDVRNVLKRERYTQTQTKRKRWQRKKAMKDLFGLTKDGSDFVHEKRILLVDDVCTTGATADECAIVLLEYGALRVDLLTLGRA